MADQKVDKAKKHMKCGRSSCPQDRGRDELQRRGSSKGCSLVYIHCTGVNALHSPLCSSAGLRFLGLSKESTELPTRHKLLQKTLWAKRHCGNKIQVQIPQRKLHSDKKIDKRNKHSS
ncbi:hypothetical protein, conserved [Eimeria necatrix]|uniref:Uncharacterized protein n=1 Tax=Eimeria necatrix TaxID=51315 RepID=U6MSB9_9EIME|nr:hypothetical protein, conserved [Eimeria necatrix]CDJ65998.1 hypothetical protein, conserved [Eimeria necatrix]